MPTSTRTLADLVGPRPRRGQPEEVEWRAGRAGCFCVVKWVEQGGGLQEPTRRVAIGPSVRVQRPAGSSSLDWV